MKVPVPQGEADRPATEKRRRPARTRSAAEDSSSSHQAKRTVKSADRVLTLFELLGNGGRKMSHTDIADLLEIPKSSLSQLLKNLVDRGWLAYDAGSKNYSLGDAIERIARSSTKTPNLVDLARPILADLTAKTNETSALTVLRGDVSETIATVQGGEILTAVLRTGDRAPLYTTAFGKVMLAHMAHDAREEYLARIELVARTPRTIQSPEELRLQIDAVRRDGFGYSFEENIRGVVGVARAVLAPNGSYVATLSVEAAAARFDSAARLSITESLEQAAVKLQNSLDIFMRNLSVAPPSALDPLSAVHWVGDWG